MSLLYKVNKKQKTLEELVQQYSYEWQLALVEDFNFFFVFSECDLEDTIVEASENFEDILIDTYDIDIDFLHCTDEPFDLDVLFYNCFKKKNIQKYLIHIISDKYNQVLIAEEDTFFIGSKMLDADDNIEYQAISRIHNKCVAEIKNNLKIEPLQKNNKSIPLDIYTTFKLGE